MILREIKSNYMDLPGLSVLIGGMLIINLNYWGCNQYITQRALELILKLLETEYYLLRFEIINANNCSIAWNRLLCCIKMGILEPKYYKMDP
jgi:hypothetical protein